MIKQVKNKPTYLKAVGILVLGTALPFGALDAQRVDTLGRPGPTLPPAGVTVQAVVPGNPAVAGVQGLNTTLPAPPVSALATGVVQDINADPLNEARRAAEGATLSSEYSRQVFSYPREGRPDPVQPPASLGASSTEENLSVAGIIVNPHNPRLSRAMIRARGFGKTRYAVAAGDKIDQYTVLQVKNTSVVLSVPVLGGSRTLELQRSRDKNLELGTEGTGAGNRTVITEMQGQTNTPVPGLPQPGQAGTVVRPTNTAGQPTNTAPGSQPPPPASQPGRRN